MKDPFSSDKARFLVLGSRCSVCGRLVCVGPVGTPGDLPGFLPRRSGCLLITRWKEGGSSYMTSFGTQAPREGASEGS